jgi:hypothetical protein
VQAAVDEPLSITIPFGSMLSLKSLQLTAIEMPHSSWQELSNINAAAAASQAAAQAAAALTTRHSSGGSTATNKGLTELVLSNSSLSLQEMTVVKLQGLRRLQLGDWQGTARELSAALASSRNALTELSLNSCTVGVNSSSTAGAAPHYQGQAVAVPQAPVQAAAAHAVASPQSAVCKFAAMLANLPKLEALELRNSCVKLAPGVSATSDAPPETTTQPTLPVPLLGLRRLDIAFQEKDELPTALLSVLSPCTLTRLELSAVSSHSYIWSPPGLVRQLPRLQQLQHCKLGYSNSSPWSWGAAGSTAAHLAAVRGLSCLTYLCMERGGLTAKELARHLYCKPDVLPQLRLLEIKRVVTWDPLDYKASMRMGPWSEVELCNVKFEAEVGAVQRYNLQSLTGFIWQLTRYCGPAATVVWCSNALGLCA